MPDNNAILPTKDVSAASHSPNCFFSSHVGILLFSSNVELATVSNVLSFAVRSISFRKMLVWI